MSKTKQSSAGYSIVSEGISFLFHREFLLEWPQGRFIFSQQGPKYVLRSIGNPTTPLGYIVPQGSDRGDIYLHPRTKIASFEVQHTECLVTPEEGSTPQVCDPLDFLVENYYAQTK